MTMSRVFSFWYVSFFHAWWRLSIVGDLMRRKALPNVQLSSNICPIAWVTDGYGSSWKHEISSKPVVRPHPYWAFKTWGEQVPSHGCKAKLRQPLTSVSNHGESLAMGNDHVDYCWLVNCCLSYWLLVWIILFINSCKDWSTLIIIGMWTPYLH